MALETNLLTAVGPGPSSEWESHTYCKLRPTTYHCFVPSIRLSVHVLYQCMYVSIYVVADTHNHLYVHTQPSIRTYPTIYIYTHTYIYINPVHDTIRYDVPTQRTISSTVTRYQLPVDPVVDFTKCLIKTRNGTTRGDKDKDTEG